jgi:glycosyltransferase involved in cell wall biosynthesis
VQDLLSVSTQSTTPSALEQEPRQELLGGEELTRSSRRPRIIVVIPAFNEERFIGSVVVKARRYGSSVIVIDDGSTDGTSNVASEAGAIVFRHRTNLGKGAALGTGFEAAYAMDPDAVVTIDGDGQHLTEEIELVAGPVLRGEADVVIGSRYLEPRSDVPRTRVLGHQVFNFVTNQSSGVSVSDSQSGFRAFSPAAAQAISFESRGFSVESEMQFIARQLGLKLVEVPIVISYHDKPKRNVFAHGILVLNGMLGLIGQHRPLLFFCVPSAVLGLLGLLLGLQVVNIYQTSGELAVGYGLMLLLFATVSIVGFSTGIVLHSVRGLILSIIRSSRVRTSADRIDGGGAGAALA